ncbi:MAG: cytochrome c [Planctomycetota bacterium]|jgi:hypothetical protein
MRWTLVLLLAACAPPKRDFDADQIAAVQDLEELMYVQATVADPRFRLARDRKPEELTDSDYAQFLDMGTRLQLTAKRLTEWARSRGFEEYAKEQGARAATVAALARSRDAEGVLRAVLSVRDTCAACHGEFR